MNERLEWGEIVSRYPDQWVGLVDVDWKNESNIRSAVVRYIGKTSDELAIMQLEDDNLFSTYTTPDNLWYLGIV